MRLVYLGYTFNCTLHLDKDPFWSHLLLSLNRSLWGCWTCCGVNKLCRHHWGYWTGEKYHFNLTHLILEDSCVEMLIVQTTGTWLSARDQQLVCCDWLQSAHLSHWLSRRQAGSFNFQVISLRGCVILWYFYHSDPICMMQRDDTVQTDGVAKFLLQRVFNNYSSGHKWNSFTQSSNTLTTYNDLCPESDDSIEDFGVIVTNICFHMENQDWMMTSVSQSSAPVLDQTSWLV